MKKITALLLALLMLVGALAGCGKQNDTNKTDKLSIVTTIFPEYDWVREILGDKADNAEVTMLLNNGVDLHSYQPTADDIVKISDCDLFIYVGGESDGWVDDALKNATNKNMKVINLLDVLGDSVKTEEVVEGMQEAEAAPFITKKKNSLPKKTFGKCRLISSQSGVIESCPAGSNSGYCLPVRCAPHKKCCSWTSLFPGLIPK